MVVCLGWLLETNSPRKRRIDSIEGACPWIIQTSLLILFLTLPRAVLAEADNPNNNINAKESADYEEFFHHCSGGKLKEIQAALETHPDWVHARTPNGEACLHLTGIFGHSDVTRYLLTHGADPNIRSTYSEGLRMHPLSWNVYGGHIENIELLLQHGAEVNLDFDGMAGSSEVTALDVVKQIQSAENGDERFTKIEALLLQHGAKTYSELQQAKSKEEL